MLVFRRGLLRFSSFPVALLALVFAACADDGTSLPDLGRDALVGADLARDQALVLADGGTGDTSEDGKIVLREAGADTSVDTRFVCNPPAASGSIYELSASTIFREISMCEFRDRVLLVVNIAAKWGYTPQLGELAQLQTAYGGRGLQVLGFYSDDFNQAGTEDERLACEAGYNVNFPVFAPVHVNGVDEHAIFSWLKSQPGAEGDIGWNFVKFLLDGSGDFVARYATATSPLSDSVVTAIEGLVAPAP